MEKINYRVNVNWIDFDFNYAYQAMHFAELAAEHIKDTTKRISIDIVIKEEFECCECCDSSDEEFEEAEEGEEN